jgi:Tol biopolymer transport system component
MKLQNTTKNLFSTALFLAMLLCALPLIADAQGKIAFNSNRSGNFEIYVMNSNGSNQTRLTTAGGVTPAFSPDGSKIAFVSGDGIYVMNADGSNPMRLTNNSAGDTQPSFSPDGSRIVFQSFRDNNLDIYVMNADGSNQTRLTTNSAIDESPTFSPDGSKIAFVSNRNDNFDIYVMNADGSNQTRLTNNEGVDVQPAFSPDGSRIAFYSTRNGGDIYVMNADGSNQTNITNGSKGSKPAFSPNGTRIVFQSQRDGNPEIYVMNADGSNQTRLTDNPSYDGDPAWGFGELDADGDGVADETDNCPAISNPDQLDTDSDGQGNACDEDDDNDGSSDVAEIAAGSDPLNSASTPEVCDGADNDLDGSVDEGFLNTDGDALANCVDPDDDNDGVLDTADNCPLTSNSDQADFDEDGIGDACDPQTGPPKRKEQCKDGGWMRFDFPRTFRNQGDCTKFVNAGN